MCEGVGDTLGGRCGATGALGGVRQAVGCDFCLVQQAVADAADALIETQVRAGLVVRMAVLYDLLTSGPKPVQAEVPMEVA